MSPDSRRLHSWGKPPKQPQQQAAAQQGGSLIEQHLYTLGMQIGQVLTKIDGLEEGEAGIKKELRDEAAAIRRAIDGLAKELRDELNEQDDVLATQSDRIAALERHIVAQEAEARGIRRALGWGATILSGAGVLLGWFLSKFGTVILYSLGLGGSGGGK